MDFNEVKEKSDRYLFQNYGRIPLSFTHGRGCYLYGSDGREYLDLVAGIAVNALGYNHPVFTDALVEQAKKVTVISNYFYSEPRGLMAEQLVKGTNLGKVFFGNSGAEANECSIKLARKYFYKRGENKYKIVTAKQSFHGRTIATVTATGQEQYNKPFAPLPGGIGIYVPYNDEEALAKALDDKEVAALLIEPIQGEGGIMPATESYMKLARELTKKNGQLLILDEVQTGAGRTGKFWAFEHYGIEPDVVSAAKGIGGGFPISACLATDEVAEAWTPGDHGTTFGSAPLACAVGYAVCKKIREPGFMEDVTRKGEHLRERLREIKHPKVKEVRGMGLIDGMEVEDEAFAGAIYKDMLAKGYILNVCGHKVMRFVPPLIITVEQIDEMIEELKKTVAAL